MTTLLTIRFIQFKRNVSGARIGLLLLLGIFAYFVFAVYKIYQQNNQAWLLTIGLFLFCLSLQAFRKDKLFVFAHVDYPRQSFFLEYLVLVLPFSISSLFTSNWLCFPVLILLVGLVPFLKYSPSQKTHLRKISKIIPPYYFEWISGLRSSYLYILPLYGLALAFSWYYLISLVLLWFITVSITSFYAIAESLTILRVEEANAKAFLIQKLKKHSLLLLYFYLPVVCIGVLSHPQYWLVYLLFIPTQLALLCFAICLKYAHYRPNHSNAANSVILSLTALGAILPFLLPVPLVLLFVYYRKALNNLSDYLA